MTAWIIMAAIIAQHAAAYGDGDSRDRSGERWYWQRRMIHEEAMRAGSGWKSAAWFCFALAAALAVWGAL